MKFYISFMALGYGISAALNGHTDQIPVAMCVMIADGLYTLARSK